jgi:hypothetical protein
MHGSFENNLRKCKSGHEQRVRNGRHARVKHVFPGGVRRRDSISCASQRLLAQWPNEKIWGAEMRTNAQM